MVEMKAYSQDLRDKVINPHKTYKYRIKAISYIIFGIILVVLAIYARIIHNLYEQNITIGTHDMLIAATAITKGFPILTLNVKDFKRIQGLEVLTASLKD